MAFSKTQRIVILLVIDALFFLLELVVGQAVHSLALVADSFHMLNDVLSLCVAFWAVRVASTRTSSKMYTYGWQRAEILGALINGVFLVALCVSIFLEAIQRFIDPPKISNPKLILIVGCAGLASNVVGLFLFHEHSHGHGEQDHAEDPLSTAEAGHAHYDHEEAERIRFADPAGNVEDVLPQNAVGVGPFKPSYERSGQSGVSSRHEFSKSEETQPVNTPNSQSLHQRHRRRTSSSLGRGFGSVDNIHVHPATFRNDLITAGQKRNDSDSETTSSDLEDEEEAPIEDPTIAPSPGQTNQGLKLLPSSHVSPSKSSRRRTKSRNSRSKNAHTHSHNKSNITQYDGLRRDSLHTNHHHAKPSTPSAKGHGHGHSHSHGDSNMRGVFLHVLGDALGNIGVIASALFIWLTSFSWRFYMDPTISVIITIIILWSAIPLCLSTSRILLQGVPNGISVDEIQEDIEALPGIKSVHHLHVWALSETKSIASLHVKVDCQAEGRGSASYMHLALQIRRCLHEFGIHSSTIQPEFCLKEDGEPEEEGDGEDGEHTPILKAQRDVFNGAGTMSSGNANGGRGVVRGDENVKPGGGGGVGGATPRRTGVPKKACVLECVEECEPGKRCCGKGEEGE